MIGRITAAQAARLHAAFVEDLVSRLAGGPFALRIAWALDDGEAVPNAIDGVPLPPHLVHRRQIGRDLGARLHHALADAARTHARVAAVGSDHPELPRAVVEEAFTRLDRADVVLGPAADGGYYLIALRAAAVEPGLFTGVPWSTPSVLETTLHNAERLGLRVAMLPLGHDVDDPEDLERLLRRLREDEALSRACPRTWALVAGWIEG